MHIQEAIQLLIDKNDLAHDDMYGVMRDVMDGKYTDPQIAGFLVALRSKGETIVEITAAAQIMRQLANRVPSGQLDLIDTCGTGGDASSTFNISTTSAFVVAAAGANVAKHGNRSVSSKSGSADLLEAAGVKIDLNAEQVAQCIADLGIGFMFAPLHHSAMKHAIGARRQLGVRTLFNVLGPLTNPAGAKRQLMGVFSKEWLAILPNVLKELGSVRVMVVHAEDGMDEISIAAPTHVAELRDGAIKNYTIEPEQFNMHCTDSRVLKVENVQQSLERMYAVLGKQGGPSQDIVLLNAGAAIYIAGIADTLAQGIESARSVIESGKARAKLDDLVKLSNTF